MSKYKAIAFDYGWVIEILGGINPLKITADELKIPIEQVREVYFKYNHISNAENKTWYEMFDFVLEELVVDEKTKKKIVELVKENHNKNYLNSDLINIISDIKKLGYKIAIFE